MRNLRLIIIAGVLVVGIVLAMDRSGEKTNDNTNTTEEGIESTAKDAKTAPPSNENTKAPSVTSGAPVTPTNTTASTNTSAASNPKPTVTFVAESRPASVTAISPAHASRLTALPSDLSVTFAQPVASKPALSIQRDGVEYGVGDVVIADSGLAIRRGLSASVPDGVYTMNYYACLQDGTCVSGYAQFALS